MAERTSAPELRRPARAGLPGWGRWVVAVFIILALAESIGATTGLRHTSSAVGASPASDEATVIAKGIQAQLTTVVFSQGNFVGHANTEADLVNLVRGGGGILLSFTDGPANEPGGGHTADVMLLPYAGLAASCYRYTFGNAAAWSVQESGVPCPARRTDGQPGSVAAQAQELFAMMRVVLPVQPKAGYPLTEQGAQEFLARTARLPAQAGTLRLGMLGSDSRDGVLAAAVQVNGACFFLRMSAPSNAPPNEADDLWLAPFDDQAPGSCTGAHALAASELYGINPAQEG